MTAKSSPFITALVDDLSILPSLAHVSHFYYAPEPVLISLILCRLISTLPIPRSLLLRLIRHPSFSSSASTSSFTTRV